MTAAEYQAAVAFARDVYVPHGAPWPNQLATAYRLMGEAAPDSMLPGLLEDARTDGAKWDALALIAADLLRARDPLPPALADWLADGQTGTRRRPTGPGGPDPAQTQNRNSAAVFAVASLREKGYWPITRAKSKPGMILPARQLGRAGAALSVCDAVAEAFGVSYSTMEGK